MRRLVLAITVAGVTAGLTMSAAVGLGSRTSSDQEAVSGAGGTSSAAVAAARGGDLAEVVAGLQAHLRRQPRDATSWASLAVAYVEQSRLTGDPTYYPKADEALARSERLQSSDNAPAAAGRAILASARHDFTASLQHADEALSINPYDEQALAARVDALTELGRYDEALLAAEAADRLRPGVTTFTRLSYQAELWGRSARARTLLENAAAVSTAPGDLSFVHFHLGELARKSGDVGTAREHYETALAADEDFIPALTGLARIAAAAGDTGTAVQLWDEVVTRLPLPEHLVAFGELLQSLGRDEEARQQFDVVRAAAALAAANGVVTDLELALFEADHGSAAAAVATAQREWERRRSVHVADALAWALHAAGRDAEALPYAREATSLGGPDASFLFHRAEIERALGRDADAAKHFRLALRTDPHFSALHAPAARAFLDTLEGAR